jgi:hypothetical protein
VAIEHPQPKSPSAPSSLGLPPLPGIPRVARETGQGTGLRVARAGASLSMSHNSTEPDENLNRLTGSHMRMSYVIAHEIQHLAKIYGIDRLGFLTLTFADHVTQIREAQRRFNSLATHVLKARYERCIGVWERQQSRRLHIHLIVVLPSDIRSGFRFADLHEKQGRARYASASKPLKSEWNFWRATAKRYRFGRTELLPVKSSADGIAFYVGKYLGKHIAQRVQGDKKARLVTFIGYKAGTRSASANFGWNNERAKLWRLKCAEFCRVNKFTGPAEIKRRFGPRWCYLLQEQSLNVFNYRPETLTRVPPRSI